MESIFYFLTTGYTVTGANKNTEWLSTVLCSRHQCSKPNVTLTVIILIVIDKDMHRLLLSEYCFASVPAQ